MTADFLSSWHDRQTLLIRRDDAVYYNPILTIEVVDEYLATARLDTEFVRLVNFDHPIRVEEYASEAGTIDPVRLQKLMAGGATLVLSHMELRLPALAWLCRSFEQTLAAPCVANLYLSPANAQGFRTHHDTHDVYILQVNGTKRWRTYAPIIERPLPGQANYWNEPPLSSQTGDSVLEAGDLLYFPRGTPHDARASDQPSLHITLGAHSITWTEVLVEAISELALRDPEFRIALSPDLQESRSLHKDLAATYDRLIERLRRRGDPAEVVDKLFERFASTRRPFLLQQRANLERLAELTLQTALIARAGLIYRLTKHSSEARLVCHQTRMVFPLEATPALRRALSREAFRPVDLPGSIDSETKLKITRFLLQEGLIVITDPASASSAPAVGA
jgi:ribosomal protein L16 Arg81 hydroxylase